MEGLSAKGVDLIEMSQVLDSQRPGLLISGYQEFSPRDLVPTGDALHAAFVEEIVDEGLRQVVLDAFARPYTISTDNDALLTLQPAAEKGPAGFKRSQTSAVADHERSSVASSATHSPNGVFSRLSQLGSTAGSVATAPAFYRSNMSMSGASFTNGSLLFGRGHLAPAKEPIYDAASSSSSSTQASGDDRSIIGSRSSHDLLGENFEDLSVRMRQKKDREHRQSMLLFKSGDEE